MFQYIVRRLLWTIPVLLAIMTATFILAHAIPGGPFDFRGEKQLPESIRKNLERKYQLDKPVYVQLGKWIWDALRLDLGPSYTSRAQTVNDILKRTFPISFQLGILALLLALCIGIPMGTIAAVKQNTVVDYGATFVAILGVSIPNVVLGPLLIWIFALKLGWFPAARWGTDYTQLVLGFFPPITSAKFWLHAILPAFTLGTAYSASIARLTRASLLQVIREEYMRTAYAKGLHSRRVIILHGLRNSLIPVATVLGPMFAAVVTGSMVVEQIFGIPGMGRYFVTSVTNRDYPLVMGATLVYSLLLVFANLLVDISYAWLDPRIRYD
ncbi:MAG: ABC transporter permease [Candidatus Acetothermia bacterium]|jgi:oligopeptide transport system permease protein|nr:ABC transporter permease [Candidatus Acetothermia bacterium]